MNTGVMLAALAGLAIAAQVVVNTLASGRSGWAP